MSRLVTVKTIGPVAAAAAAPRDSTLTRIGKYVPAEILAFFAMWTQAVGTFSSSYARVPVEVAGVLIGLVATYIYFDRFFPGAPVEARNAHRWISTLAFAVYAYNLSAPVLPSGCFIPGAALLATALITLISALVEPTKK